MIRYNQEHYNTCREMVTEDVAVQLLVNILKGKGVILSNSDCQYIMHNFFLRLSQMFYKVPDAYIDLGRYALYRTSNINNLITLETKGDYNADDLYSFYTEVYLPKLEMTDVVSSYISGSLEYSFKTEKTTNNKIQQLQGLLKEQKKEKNNGF